jgi:hypothetical protein
MEFIMKRLIAALALTVLAVPAMAQHYHGPQGVPFVRGNNNWVGPAIIGGVIGYALAQPRVVYTQPPVVYAPQPQQWCEHRVVVDQYGIQRTAQVCWYQ